MTPTTNTGYEDINLVLFGSTNCLKEITFTRKGEGKIEVKCREFGKCNK